MASHRRHFERERLPHGFTLIELLVSLVIISILASLTLAGMAGARQRAKMDKTKSTIRKLHETIVPQYENYMRRRVPTPPPPPPPALALKKRDIATDRLTKLRTLQMREMPDTWVDVYDVNALASVPGYLKTAPIRSYAQVAASVSSPGDRFSSEECLFMIVARSGYETDVLETFRSDEIADKDGDGAPEFIDGWGTPIHFLRWAPGYNNAPLSYVQVNDAATNHDPFDPMRVDTPAYALVPLIVSAGPDMSLGLIDKARQSSGWNSLGLASIITTDSTTGQTDGTDEHSDNITNHAFAAE